MPVDRDTFDYVAVALQIAGLLVTGFGLAFVVASLNQTAKQHRVEAGPYVRVDIAAGDEATSSFRGPEPYFRRQDLFIDLSGGASDGIMISAWFRNYQSHPLGMAIGVSSVFLVDTGDVESVLNDVFIAYVGKDKPVMVDIARVSRSVGATVRLLSLAYVDFYDRRYTHVYGEPGTNALHGRMICTVDPVRIESLPNARPRGSGVDFEGLNERQISH